MSDEKTFANGFIFKRNEKAPDFVVGRLSVKLDEAIAFMKEHDKGGWVNLNIKQARSGNYYIELDTYDPSKSRESEEEKPKKSSASKPDSKKAAPKKASKPQDDDDDSDDNDGPDDDLPF